MNEGSFTWAGVIAMLAISLMLINLAWPVVGGWEDDWRKYAHESRFGGVCTSETPPPECATDPPPGALADSALDADRRAGSRSAGPVPPWRSGAASQGA